MDGSSSGSSGLNNASGLKNKYLQMIKKLHKSELISQNLKRGLSDGSSTHNSSSSSSSKNDFSFLQNVVKTSIKSDIVKFYLNFYEKNYVDFQTIFLEYLVKIKPLDRIYCLIYYGHLILQLNFKTMIDLNGNGNIAYTVLHGVLLKDLPKVMKIVLNPSSSSSSSLLEDITCGITNLDIAFEIFSVICLIFNQQNRKIELNFDHEKLTKFDYLIVNDADDDLLDLLIKINIDSCNNQKTFTSGDETSLYYEKLFAASYKKEEQDKDINDTMLTSDKNALVDTWKVMEQTYHLKQFLIQFYKRVGFSITPCSVIDSVASKPLSFSSNITNSNKYEPINSVSTNGGGHANSKTNDESMLHRIEIDRERHKKYKEQNWIVERRSNVLEYAEFETLWNSNISEDSDTGKTFKISGNDMASIKLLQTIYSQSI